MDTATSSPSQGAASQIAKSAFSLLSHLGVQQIITAITFDNTDLLKSAPGVGKKSAEQIVLSLKDKISKLEIGFSTKEKPIKAGAKVSAENKQDAMLVRETLAACQELGFKDQDVLPLLQKHLQNSLASTHLKLKFWWWSSLA